MTMSARRFLARPAGVRLEAWGLYWPRPSADSRAGCSPAGPLRYETTETARRADRTQFELYSVLLDGWLSVLPSTRMRLGRYFTNRAMRLSSTNDCGRNWISPG